jgi:hypothetical protein
MKAILFLPLFLAIALQADEAQFLRCARCAGATFLENKCSQSASIKPAWFLSKPLEQLANVNAIVAEGHITGTPLPVHPRTEGLQHSGIVNRGLDRPMADDPSISHVVHEQANTMEPSRRIRLGVV